MEQRLEDAAGSEACMAFCAPISAESGSMKEGSEACCYSLRRQAEGRDLQQAAQGKSRRAEEGARKGCFAGTAHSGSRRAVGKKAPMTDRER